MSPRACRGAPAIALLALATPGGAATTDNVLARVRGQVAYGPLLGPVTKPLIGRIGVPGDTRVATAFRSAASVTLADSSVVEIGDNTDVTVMAFADGDAFDPQRVLLRQGAIRFTIRHPRGARTTYHFVTPTTQIAVRGTRAYLVVGPAGEQLYCVDCPPGDVVATVNGRSYAVESGRSLDVRIVGAVRNAEIVPNDTINNPAIDQFLDGRSPFGEPASEGRDPTGSESGKEAGR